MSYRAFINSAQLLTTTFVCMLNFGILDSAVPVQARLSLVAITVKGAWAISSNLLDYPEENRLK